MLLTVKSVKCDDFVYGNVLLLCSVCISSGTPSFQSISSIPLTLKHVHRVGLKCSLGRWTGSKYLFQKCDDFVDFLNFLIRSSSTSLSMRIEIGEVGHLKWPIAQCKTKDVLTTHWIWSSLNVRDIFYYYYYFQNSGAPNDDFLLNALKTHLRLSRVTPAWPLWITPWNPQQICYQSSTASEKSFIEML